MSFSLSLSLSLLQRYEHVDGRDANYFDFRGGTPNVYSGACSHYSLKEVEAMEMKSGRLSSKA